MFGLECTTLQGSTCSCGKMYAPMPGHEDEHRICTQARHVHTCKNGGCDGKKNVQVVTYPNSREVCELRVQGRRLHEREDQRSTIVSVCMTIHGNDVCFRPEMLNRPAYFCFEELQVFLCQIMSGGKGLTRIGLPSCDDSIP
jgi:hypothetical protein